jgi:hypothetical protein
MPNENAKNPELFVDNEPYQWHESVITEAQLRQLASVPAGVNIFQKIPGRPDREVLPGTTVDLSRPGPERFSTQAVGSQAG